jgi:hypothetical protein
VVAYREGIGQLTPCAECIGYVALLDAQYIGRKVWLQRPAQSVEGPFLVGDCGPQDVAGRQALLDRDWVVDVQYEIGVGRWDMHGPLAGVRVYFEPPPIESLHCWEDKPCHGKW